VEGNFSVASIQKGIDWLAHFAFAMRNWPFLVHAKKETSPFTHFFYLEGQSVIHASAFLWGSSRC